MFVKKKPNRSGSTTVAVARKSRGRTIYIKNFGTSADPSEVARLVANAQAYIHAQQLLLRPELDFEGAERRRAEESLAQAERVISSIENVVYDAPRRILGRVFDAIGFGAVGDDIFRSLVIARLSFPSSKRATVEYLRAHFEQDIRLHKIYRYLDSLDDSRCEAIQRTSVRHTMAVHGGKLGVLFYDVTTLYFDTDQADDLRRPGYSKDGKHSNQQLVLGLLVSADGCPLAYTIHEGCKYEGHTMLPIVRSFVGRYELEDFVVVADAGMMSEDNIADLEANGMRYIIGARLRNLPPGVRERLLSWEKSPKELISCQLGDGGAQRLVVGFSEKRAAKDASNREKGIAKLRKRFASGTITKSKITQRGYNKFLKVSGTGRMEVAIDEALVAEEARWDGLKGYVTNADLSDCEVVEAYHELYNVEQSFRIAKSKLEIRPMFHFNAQRIRAHVCICFVALKVYRELDRLLKLNKLSMSVDTVLNIAKTIPTIRVATGGGSLTKTLFLTAKHRQLIPLFDDKFWGSQNNTDNQRLMENC